MGALFGSSLAFNIREALTILCEDVPVPLKEILL